MLLTDLLKWFPATNAVRIVVVDAVDTNVAAARELTTMCEAAGVHISIERLPLAVDAEALTLDELATFVRSTRTTH